MFVDNEPYGIEAVCDHCKVPIEDDEFDFRQKWVNHIHADCFYRMLDEDGRLPGNLPIYFNHEYKGNWEELIEEQCPTPTKEEEEEALENQQDYQDYIDNL